MVSAKEERKPVVLHSRKYPLGTDVEVKNRADGVIVVVRGETIEEKQVRK